MDRFGCVFVLFSLIICGCLGQHTRYNDYRPSIMEYCGECNPEKCVPPTECAAGMVKDRCGCCEECAKAEYELCDHPGVNSHNGEYRGKCGDNLECRLRDDLEPGAEPEAICFCTIEGNLCGSDDETYTNICQLMETAIIKRQKITVKSKGPCKSAPQVVTPPEHVKNASGSNVFLACEAIGFPIPSIEWTWTRVDGKTVYLPSDDLRVSTNMRGGPEKWQVTGWLQIMDLQKDHEGDYTCIAQNDLGLDKGVARIKVVMEEREEKRHYKKRPSKIMRNL